MAMAVFSASVAHMYGANYTQLQPMKLTADSMPAMLYAQNENAALANAATMLMPQGDADNTTVQKSPLPEVSEWATKTTTVKPYKLMDDLTFIGVPIFAAGIIAKSEKASFRQNTEDQAHSNTRLLTNFHTEIDNYTQFAPAVLAAGLNFSGVEGRSDTWRFLASTAMSYAIMAGFVNSIKYTAQEMRPDGSTRNSWPSGHTATAFVSASILHKEYGLTRSPIYSVAGYAMATATGIMRVLNNRHWVSDVLSGAGIGIMSTELAYGLSDIIFKGKHLKRNDLDNTANIIENPSFFSVSMGIGLGSRNLSFNARDFDMTEYTTEGEDITSDIQLKFGAATVVGVEGAYFFNKYIGVGGRLKVRSTPIKGWSNMTSKQRDKIAATYNAYSSSDAKMDWWIPVHDLTIESDHITEFSANAGLYFNLPLSSRFALGSKLLIGRSVIQDLDVDAHFAGNTLIPSVDTQGHPVGVKGEAYDITWDYMTVSGNNTMTYGTGLSLTYAYKSNFSWKLFVDYDFTRKHYTMDLNETEFTRVAFPEEYDNICAYYDGSNFNNNGTNLSSTIKKTMNNFVIGGAFCVSF